VTEENDDDRGHEELTSGRGDKFFLNFPKEAGGARVLLNQTTSRWRGVWGVLFDLNNLLPTSMIVQSALSHSIPVSFGVFESLLVS
jgi:hypothetical protein